MRVRIDAAGNHEFAGGVDSLVHLHLQARADDGDALVFDQNVGFVIIDRGHNTAVLDKSFHRFMAVSDKVCWWRRRRRDARLRWPLDQAKFFP